MVTPRPGRVLRLLLLPLLCLMAADTCHARPQEQSTTGNIQPCPLKIPSHYWYVHGQLMVRETVDRHMSREAQVRED